jgi:8-oxo-dGTP diphosphatase
MNKYTISAGLIFNDKNQILLVKHIPEFGSDYYWCLPGGTADKNEGILDALIREIKEETNIDICDTDKPIYTVKHTNHKRKWDSDIYTYRIKNWSGDLEINDPDNDIVELKWFDIKQAIDAINNLPFRVMKEPLLNYLKEKKPKERWVYIEDESGGIELLE